MVLSLDLVEVKFMTISYLTLFYIKLIKFKYYESYKK